MAKSTYSSHFGFLPAQNFELKKKKKKNRIANKTHGIRGEKGDGFIPAERKKKETPKSGLKAK